MLLIVHRPQFRSAYNLRNVDRAVEGDRALTLAAFAFVIGLLVFMLGFVKGMNDLTENTGIPGNVFVLSEGSTDELFSNLGYGDFDNVDRVEGRTRRTDDVPLKEGRRRENLCRA